MGGSSAGQGKFGLSPDCAEAVPAPARTRTAASSASTPFAQRITAPYVPTSAVPSRRDRPPRGRRRRVLGRAGPRRAGGGRPPGGGGGEGRHRAPHGLLHDGLGQGRRQDDRP